MQYGLSNFVYWYSKTTKILYFALSIFSVSCFAKDVKQNDAYMVMDSFGKHYFTAPPQRVVVTDWTLLEQLLDLGIVPVGAPELEQFKQYSPFAEIPKSITDIGPRQSPSLNTISKLNPDLIILGTDQKTLTRPLSRMCKVLYYQNFSPRFDSNGQTALKRNGQISEIFKKRTLSDSLIQEFTGQLEEHKKILAENLETEEVTILIVRVFPTGNMLAYSSHSIAGYVVEQLGLNNLIESTKSKFGEQVITKQDVYQASPRYVLCFGACSNELFSFKDLNTDFLSLREHWPYGGISTMSSLAQEITEKIISR